MEIFLAHVNLKRNILIQKDETLISHTGIFLSSYTDMTEKYREEDKDKEMIDILRKKAIFTHIANTCFIISDFFTEDWTNILHSCSDLSDFEKDVEKIKCVDTDFNYDTSTMEAIAPYVRALSGVFIVTLLVLIPVTYKWRAFADYLIIFDLIGNNVTWMFPHNWF